MAELSQEAMIRPLKYGTKKKTEHTKTLKLWKAIPARYTPSKSCLMAELSQEAMIAPLKYGMVNKKRYALHLPKHKNRIRTSSRPQGAVWFRVRAGAKVRQS